jgi:DNA polymerase III delta subunit
VEGLLGRAPAGAEVHRFRASSVRRDQMDRFREEVMEHLEGGSLFGAPQVVVVLDRVSILGEKAVQHWLERPRPGTHLVVGVAVGTGKQRPPKYVAKLGVPVLDAPLPRDRRKWLGGRAEALGARLTAGALERIEELAGDSLDRQLAEVEKLSLYRPEESIRAEDVEALVGRSAGRDLDRLVQSLLAGDFAGALASQQAMAEEGLRMFDGSRLYGESAISGALLPILLHRIRRMAAVGGVDPGSREELTRRLGMNPFYARRLTEEARRLGPRRLASWASAALAAETLQKRIGGVPDREILTSLFFELTRTRP